MKESSCKSYDELPLFLNAETVAKLPSISCYELLCEKGVPVAAHRQPNRRVDVGRSSRRTLRCRMRYNRYPVRDAAANYFPLPNEIFSLGLSGGEILVYSYLMYREDRRTYECHPSYRGIGGAVGMSRNTVRKYVNSLEAKHLIATAPTDISTKDGRRRNGSLLYRLRPIEEATAHYRETQLRRIEAETTKTRAAKALAEYDRKHPKAAVLGGDSAKIGLKTPKLF